jgi:hypothetical protein
MRIPAVLITIVLTLPNGSGCLASDSDLAGNAALDAQCGGAPSAWLLAPPDSAAGEWLTRAGFVVAPLPLDVSPTELQGVIVLASDASLLPEYGEYMQRHADELFDFVDAANVVLALPQPAATEPEPPYLPSTHAARRGSTKLTGAEVLAPDHPLLRGVEVDGGRLAWRGAVGRDAFAEQDGFQVIVAGAGDGTHGGLLEGAYGQGRIVLSALALDGPAGASAEQDAFVAAFWDNLAEHVTGVCARERPPVTPTPAPEPTPFTARLDDVRGAARHAGLHAALPGRVRQPDGVDRPQRRVAGRSATRFTSATSSTTTPIASGRGRPSSMQLLADVVPVTDGPRQPRLRPVGRRVDARDRAQHGTSRTTTPRARDTFGGRLRARASSTTRITCSTAGGHAWIAVALEWGPRDEVIAWANDVMTQHPDRLGIFVTHAYLNNNDRRYDHTDTEHPQDFNPHEYATPGGVNDGEELWQKLVRKHRFVMTLSGHVVGDGTGYLASTTDRGNICHQMMSNFQMRELGGEGYMRLLELLPDGETLVVRTYSPVYDRYLMGADQQMTLTLDVD